MKKAPIILCTIVVLSVGATPDLVQGTSFKPGTAPSSPTINCSNPVMTSAPKFLASPAGAAEYPFTLSCNSLGVPAVISVTMEGSWSLTETRHDRPNDSESVTIRGYEPFLKDRAPGGTMFMYWTGSCTADPWLQGSTCNRFGEYIPDDIRLAGSDDIQFVLLTPDGKRFDAQGTRTGIKASTADASHPLSDKAVQDALQTVATKPRSVSPACQPNPADIGPGWIPVPCTMPTAASGGTP